MADITITAASVVAGTDASIESGSAGEAITAGQAVYRSSTTRKWLRADSNSVTPEARKAVGIALNGASLNQPIAVQKSGSITLGATLVPGTAYHLSDAPGSICPLADVDTGEYVCQLGLATSTTALALDVQFPNVSL